MMWFPPRTPLRINTAPDPELVNYVMDQCRLLTVGYGWAYGTCERDEPLTEENVEAAVKLQVSARNLAQFVEAHQLLPYFEEHFETAVLNGTAPKKVISTYPSALVCICVETMLCCHLITARRTQQEGDTIQFSGVVIDAMQAYHTVAETARRQWAFYTTNRRSQWN